MDSQSVVTIFGRSLLVDGVAAGLKSLFAGDIIRFDDITPDAEALLTPPYPEVVILPLGNPQFKTLIPMLMEMPGTTILGLNEELSQVVVLKSFAKHISKITDLHEIIQSAFCGEPQRQEGGVHRKVNEKVTV